MLIAGEVSGVVMALIVGLQGGYIAAERPISPFGVDIGQPPRRVRGGRVRTQRGPFSTYSSSSSFYLQSKRMDCEEMADAGSRQSSLLAA